MGGRGEGLEEEEERWKGGRGEGWEEGGERWKGGRGEVERRERR